MNWIKNDRQQLQAGHYWVMMVEGNIRAMTINTVLTLPHTVKAFCSITETPTEYKEPVIQCRWSDNNLRINDFVLDRYSDTVWNGYYIPKNVMDIKYCIEQYYGIIDGCLMPIAAAEKNIKRLEAFAEAEHDARTRSRYADLAVWLQQEVKAVLRGTN